MNQAISRRQFLIRSAVLAGASVLAASAPAARPTMAAFSARQLAQVPRNRTLIMAGLGGEHPGGFTDVDNFNPYAPGLSRSGLYQAATEPLFYYNMLGDEFIPWLGEGYEYNPGFTEITVKIRNGVTWSDGTPFTARDVVFSLNLLQQNPDLNYGADIQRLVKSAQVIDDHTFKVTLNFPNPRFHFDILTFRADIGTPFVPEHVWKDQDPKTFKNYDPGKGWPLGTGPYRLVETNVQQKIWDLREDWWGAKTGFRTLPKVQRLVFLPGMNEITMAQMLITNEIDMAFSLTPVNMKTVQAQNPKIITHSKNPPYGYLDWWPIGLGFNNTVPPFDDPEVRWAMSYAINRDEIIKFAFSGYSQPVQLPYPGYPALKPYIESVQDLLEKYPTNAYDPKKTDEIMTRKGYTRDQDGFWTKNGSRVTFEIVTFPQHPSTTPAAPVVTEQLRRAGFDATFQLPADFVQRIITGEAKAYLWGHGGSMKDPYRTLDLYHIRHVKPTGEPIYFTNIYRWSNKPFSDIVDQMGQLAEDDPKLKDLFHQAMEIWLPELPDIQLHETVIPLPMNTTYWTNWPTSDEGKKPYIHEGFWHRTGLLIFVNLQPTQ